MLNKAFDRYKQYVENTASFIKYGALSPEKVDEHLDDIYREFRTFLHGALRFGGISIEEYEEAQFACDGIIADAKRRFRQ